MSFWNQLASRRQSIDSRRARRLFIVAALAWALAPSAASAAGAAIDSLEGIRPQDQVWLVSTRHIGCASDFGKPAVWQWDAGQWSVSDEVEFHKAESPPPRTVIYVHGNRIDDNEGVTGGLAVYREIVARHADEEPVRFVIWSWPSTKMCRPIKDVRTKAWGSDDEAVLLARFLAKIENPTELKIGIVAFSYGARITGGALHMLGGGQLLGYTVPAGERPTFRVAFWAAAAHNDWLLPGRRHGQTLPLGEKWLNFFNLCDESLDLYEHLEKGGNPPALGYTGLAGRDQLPPELNERWEEWEVSQLISDTHNYHPYCYSPWIAQQTAQVVLGRQ